MKESNKCPKCDSSDIVRIDGGMGENQNNISTGMTIFSYVPVNRYVCVDCGFTEEWIDSPEDRAKLKKRFG